LAAKLITVYLDPIFPKQENTPNAVFP